jgi:hypothetical protein
MPATNYTPVQFYRSVTPGAAPVAGNLTFGEVALNYADEKLYFKNAAGVVKLLASGSTIVGLKEIKTAVAASNIDLAVGNFFSKTITTATTFTVSNVPATGVAASFVLDLTNGGAASITWWANLKWPAGAAPILTTSGRDVLGFFTYDNGATWTGLLLGRDVK